MKILRIQQSHNLQFTGDNNTANGKRVPGSEFHEKKSSPANGKTIFSVPYEDRLKLSKKMIQLQKRLTYDKFKALQKCIGIIHFAQK